jgi:hypothetical protein
LPLGQTNCSLCPPGTFSIGGGYRVTYWGTGWEQSEDLQFSTYCVNADGDTLDPSECAGYVFLFNDHINHNEDGRLILQLNSSFFLEILMTERVLSWNFP